MCSHKEDGEKPGPGGEGVKPLPRFGSGQRQFTTTLSLLVHLVINQGRLTSPVSKTQRESREEQPEDPSDGPLAPGGWWSPSTGDDLKQATLPATGQTSPP